GHLLYCHGNGGNLSDRYAIVQRLLRLGVSVFIFDYRGYGRSEGEPDGGGIMMDGEAARGWLAARAGLPTERLLLLGSSLGGVVAVHLAAHGQARGLVLESTFSSRPGVSARLFPVLPARLLMRYPMDSEKPIRAYSGPVFQSPG